MRKNYFFFVFIFTFFGTLYAQDAFITKWKIESNDLNLVIPVSTYFTYNFDIDWGDNSSDTGVTSDITHTYAQAGEYSVTITGDFPYIYFKDKTQLIDVTQWGTTKWENMNGSFAGCSKLSSFSASDNPDLSNVTGLNNTFGGASLFNGDISKWDVSKVTAMTNTFGGASLFNGDISNWDVSSVIDMYGMFNGASSFNGNLSNWDMSSVIDMSFMFSKATSFNSDINNWDTSNVTDMSFMFQDASSFNKDLNNWNTNKVTEMGGMFQDASSFNGNISNWDVSSVIHMGEMFMNASSFNNDISKWNVSKVTHMYGMFNGATSFNGDLSNWDVNKVIKMSFMFSGATLFNTNINNWDTSNVTHMSGMFMNASSFNGNISNWDVSSVIYMDAMFMNASSFNHNIGKWNVSNVIQMGNMFKDVTLSTDNYDALLKGWSSLSLQNNVSFYGGNSNYCTSEAERQKIKNDFNWYIIDGGKDCTGSGKTYVPDDQFEQTLIDQGYDDVLDDYVTTSNISDIAFLDVSNKNISDLTGIENFTGLKNLQCYQNNLTTIDISQNIALVSLGCSQNDLTSIDVSKNTALISFFVLQNKITSLDISKNVVLETLACGYNQISSLQVDKNIKLKELSCYLNPILEIDLSNNPDLNYLSCYDNQLTELDLSNNPLLTRLYCYNNQLLDLDLSKQTALTDLYCNNNQLTGLNVKNGNNSILINFDATNNSSLECIQVDDATAATAGQAPYSNWVKDVAASYSEDCAASDLTYIPDDNFEHALIDLGYDDVQDNYVLTANISGVSILDVSRKNIADLTGIEAFINLEYLYAYFNQISDLDITQNKLLKSFNCAGNQLTNIDISQNINLEGLSCNGNSLSSLDVSQNDLIRVLDCYDNQITDLDVSNLKSLQELGCYNNKLTSLNVKNANNIKIVQFNSLNNPDLTCIQVDDATAANAGQAPYDVWQKDQAISYSEDCSGSDTTSIPDSKFEQALIDLGILTDNTVDGSVDKTEISVVTNLNISGLDISDLSGIEDFTSLETLIVSNNQLTYLDLRNNLNLRFLNVSGNPLVTLLVADDDLLKYDNNKSTQQAATNNNFTELNITDTQLDTIALSGLPHLEIFKAQNSKLASLDVSGNGDLTTMDIRNNPLTCINVSQTQMNSIPSDWQKDVSASYNTDCQAQLGIDDETLNKGLILYPNPVSDRLNIVSELPLTKVEFFSVLGQRVKEIHTDFHSIPTGNLSKGIYFIRVYSDKGIAVKKLIRK